MVRAGGLAQLGEHLLCKQGVVGSIPSSSTIPNAGLLQLRTFKDVGGVVRNEPWRLSQSGRYRMYRLSFFNNQEEVVKRFSETHLEMGVE